MDGIHQLIPSEANLTLQMTGYLDGSRVCRVYPVIGFGLYREPGSNRYSTEGQSLLSIVLTEDPLPLTVDHLDSILEREGIEGIKYSYLKNGVPAYCKKEILPEPLKRRF